MKTLAPFGSWESVVTPEFVAGKDRGLAGNLQVDGESLFFFESRPDEGGRQVLMRRSAQGEVSEVLPSTFNVRTRYLEYGGSSYLAAGGKVFAVNFADQQVYLAESGGQPPRQLTNTPDSRYADFTWDKKRNRLLAVRERLAKPESVNTICAIDLETGAVTDIVSGRDFFNSARLNEGGDKILYTAWDHPNMAWNGTELYVADVSAEGAVTNAKKIAGDKDHAVCMPRWRGNDIYFVAELDNWLNLYRYREGQVTNLYQTEAEFAYPDWNPGQRQFAFRGDSICACIQRGGLGRVLLIEGEKVRELPLEFASAGDPVAFAGGFYLFVGYPNQPAAIGELSPSGEFKKIYSSFKLQLPAEEISVPQNISFPTADGSIGYAWFYEPKNSRFAGPAGAKPPLVVMCHGGPTALCTSDFKKGHQFWTNRGYAVVDVNYGGSTGFGRAYRERLRGNWGIVDVQDCVAVVQQLARAGKIDPAHTAIRGGSAGGYTTLAALTFTSGVIAVGASYYGVSELELLAKETHKLESRYLDQLVGSYPAAIKIYKERAPLEHTDRLNCPVIFFQGDEDRVVPPNQSELMYEALRKKGIYSEYHLYAGEGHGFRKGENIRHSLLKEHAFYARAFGYEVRPGDRT